MRIKLIKVQELEDAVHANNIEEGRVEYGIMTEKPTLGKRFTIAESGRWFSTSLVQEIIDDYNFKTFNSHYRIEILNKIVRPEININIEEDGA